MFEQALQAPPLSAYLRAFPLSEIDQASANLANLRALIPPAAPPILAPVGSNNGPSMLVTIALSLATLALVALAAVRYTLAVIRRRTAKMTAPGGPEGTGTAVLGSTGGAPTNSHGHEVGAWLCCPCVIVLPQVVLDECHDTFSYTAHPHADTFKLT